MSSLYTFICILLVIHTLGLRSRIYFWIINQFGGGICSFVVGSQFQLKYWLRHYNIFSCDFKKHCEWSLNKVVLNKGGNAEWASLSSENHFHFKPLLSSGTVCVNAFRAVQRLSRSLPTVSVGEGSLLQRHLVCSFPFFESARMLLNNRKFK